VPRTHFAVGHAPGNVGENIRGRYLRIIGEHAHNAGLLDDEPAGSVARRLQHGDRLREAERRECALHAEDWRRIHRPAAAVAAAAAGRGEQKSDERGRTMHLETGSHFRAGAEQSQVPTGSLARSAPRKFPITSRGKR
jgi:hypothetical protein